MERPRQLKMVVRFGTWNVRSLHRAGSLKTVASELAECKLDLVAVQDIRRIALVVSQQRIIHFSMEMGKLIT